MKYLCVRSYGCWQNKIYPQIFDNYDKCLDKCLELQKCDADDYDEKWIPFAVYETDKL